MLWRATPILLVLIGCEPLTVSLPDSPPPQRYPAYGSLDAGASGAVSGTVRWSGPAPKVEPLMREGNYWLSRTIPNPHSPAIDAKTSGLANAVVVLAGAFPAAKPWPFPPVEIHLAPDGFTIHQGTARGRVGFVRLGDPIRIFSLADSPVGLRARGDAFFGIILPSSRHFVTRHLHQPGIVRLTSASGQFWAHGELYVLNHPYAAITNPEGQFCLNAVPAGEYVLEVHHPNWHEAGRAIDPETGLLVRVEFARSLLIRQPVQIRAGQTCKITLEIAEADFATSR